MSLPPFNLPEKEQITLRLMEAGVELKNWISYKFIDHFLNPSDSWSFKIGDPLIDDTTANALVPGNSIQLSINGTVQSTGIIDSVERKATRTGGLEWNIAGRDKLGQANDSNADPTLQIKPQQTALDLLKMYLGPFGWPNDSDYVIDNADNRAVMTNQKRGIKLTKKKGRPVKSVVLHQLKPYPKEGCFEFVARILQRQGLWVWPTADGSQIVVGTPDFEQDPICRIIRQKGGFNNILDGTVRFDATDQPNIIIAEGSGGGGEWGHSRLRTIMANPTTFYRGAELYAPVFAKFKDAKYLPSKHSFYTVMYTPTVRILYLHDDESHTQQELDNFVYREMALRTRKSLTVHYTMEGHGQLLPDGSFVPWTVDTVVDVQDDVGGVHEPMWVLSRTLNKSRGSGTTTDLEMIRLYSLEF
jgi:prophage tail gpP-like protein